MKKDIDFADLVQQAHPQLSLRMSYNAGENQPVYVDPLGTAVLAEPNETGHNQYSAYNAKGNWKQVIHFQEGSPKDGINGLSNEALVGLLAHRLTKQQESFPSQFNLLSIKLLEYALIALHMRVDTRQQFEIYDTRHVQPSDALKAANMLMVEKLTVQQLINTLLVEFDSLALNDADLKPLSELAGHANAGDEDYQRHMARVDDLMQIFTATSIAASMCTVVDNALTIRQQFSSNLGEEEGIMTSEKVAAELTQDE